MIATRTTAAVSRASRSSSVVVKASLERRVAASIAAAGAALLVGAAPAPAIVNFLNIQDGSVVSSPVHVEMGVRGLALIPASEGLIPGTGHFHVIIDRDPAADPLAEGDVIPFDKTHLHYGKAQDEANIELSPGKHTLTLQFADALHQSYGSEERKEVTITVN